MRPHALSKLHATSASLDPVTPSDNKEQTYGSGAGLVSVADQCRCQPVPMPIPDHHHATGTHKNALKAPAVAKIVEHKSTAIPISDDKNPGICASHCKAVRYDASRQHNFETFLLAPSQLNRTELMAKSLEDPRSQDAWHQGGHRSLAALGLQTP